MVATNTPLHAVYGHPRIELPAAAFQLSCLVLFLQEPIRDAIGAIVIDKLKVRSGNLIVEVFPNGVRYIGERAIMISHTNSPVAIHRDGKYTPYMIQISSKIIEPFGYIGIPEVFDTSIAAEVIKRLEYIFYAMTCTGSLYLLDKEGVKNRLADLCGGLETIAKMARAKDISIVLVTLQRDGKLSGITFVVEFTANGKRHKHRLQDCDMRE